MDKKRINKIHNKINKIAEKGKNNKLEFYNYIDEIISNGDYVYFQEVLLKYYNINIIDEKDFNSYRERAWESICLKTDSKLSSNLSNLYKKEGVYQISYNIYFSSNNTKIGEIKEIEFISYDSYNYLVKNKEMSKILGLVKTYLEVKREDELESLIIDTDDPKISHDNNLLNRYKLALLYLKQ